MDKRILDYINTQRTAVLAVEMLDGSPHAATVHFAHTEDPLEFFFETDKAYRKAGPLLQRKQSRASLVIGADEATMKTLQLDGTVTLTIPEEAGIIDSIYLGKFPEKINKSKGPNVLFFKFIPIWWRFTDWKAPEGKIILTSEAKWKYEFQQQAIGSGIFRAGCIR